MFGNLVVKSAVRRVQRLMQFGCILLLLFGQQAALTHAVWHVSARAAAHKASDTRAVAVEGFKAPHVAALCAFDAAFGQVLGGASCGAPSSAPLHVSDGVVPHSQHASAFQLFLAPLSRGPPASLLS